MNQQLQQTFTQLLQLLTAGASLAGQQIPEILHEKILYDRIVQPGFLILWIVVFLGAILAIQAIQQATTQGQKWRAKYGYDKAETMEAFLAIGGMIASIVSLIGIFVQAASVAEVWLAPRLYLLDWLKGMIQK